MEILGKLSAWFDSTHLQEQIRDVDYNGLFTNPWFMVPFVVMLGYMIFRQKWKDLVILAICVAVWWWSGTSYMKTLFVGDEMQIGKILPVIFGGAGALGVVIYLFFSKSD